LWAGQLAQKIGPRKQVVGGAASSLTDSGLDTLASSGSCHRTKAAAFRCMSGSSRCRLTQRNGGDPPPLLQPHYRAFIATTRRSAPLRRIGTFGLAVGAACAFSLGIAGKVLTFGA